MYFKTIILALSVFTLTSCQPQPKKKKTKKSEGIGLSDSYFGDASPSFTSDNETEAHIGQGEIRATDGSSSALIDDNGVKACVGDTILRNGECVLVGNSGFFGGAGSMSNPAQDQEGSGLVPNAYETSANYADVPPRPIEDPPRSTQNENESGGLVPNAYETSENYADVPPRPIENPPMSTQNEDEPGGLVPNTYEVAPSFDDIWGNTQNSTKELSLKEFNSQDDKDFLGDYINILKRAGYSQTIISEVFLGLDKMITIFNKKTVLDSMKKSKLGSAVIAYGAHLSIVEKYSDGRIRKITIGLDKSLKLFGNKVILENLSKKPVETIITAYGIFSTLSKGYSDRQIVIVAGGLDQSIRLFGKINVFHTLVYSNTEALIIAYAIKIAKDAGRSPNSLKEIQKNFSVAINFWGADKVKNMLLSNPLLAERYAKVAAVGLSKSYNKEDIKKYIKDNTLEKAEQFLGIK